jgi:hypothetical protein
VVACVGAVNKSRNTYLIAATVVWVAIWVATGVVADNEFDDIIPILGGGTVFFIVLVPATLFRKRDEGGSTDVRDVASSGDGRVSAVSADRCRAWSKDVASHSAEWLSHAVRVRPVACRCTSGAFRFVGVVAEGRELAGTRRHRLRKWRRRGHNEALLLGAQWTRPSAYRKSLR